MSEAIEEKFEEINLIVNEDDKVQKDNLIDRFDNESTINIDSNNVTLNFSEINDSNKEQKFYHEFIDNNKEFFEKIGFKDISNDKIFFLSEEQKPRKGANLNICDLCHKEISRFFSNCKNCKFCGNILCDNCSKNKRKIPFNDQDKLSLICTYCDNKFLNISIHNGFKEELIKKEFEISESNQKLESLSLTCSDQLDEINKLNDKIISKKKENNMKEEVINNERNSLKSREIDMVSNSERTNLKINQAIMSLKSLDEKKANLEKHLGNIQKDRENISLDFEHKQNFFEDLNRKINEMSIKIKNFEQEKLEITRQTGNSKLDLLLNQKINMQRKSISHLPNHDSTIIINPSKIMTEVLKEPLIDKSNFTNKNKHSKSYVRRDSISSMSEDYEKSKKKNIFRKMVFYFGEKIFMKE